MNKSYLLFSLAIALTAFLFVPAFFSLPLLYFLPPIAISIYGRSHFFSCCLALILGLLVDLFSSAPFGLTAVSYTLTAYALFPLHRYLFIDYLSTLPTLSFLGSMFHAACVLVLNFFFDIEQAYTPLHFLAMDLFVMPLNDAAYAFLFFSLPAFALRRYHHVEVYDEDT